MDRMTSTDNLRNALAKAVIDHDEANGLDTGAYEDVIGNDYYTGLADAVLAVLADPALRDTILSGPMNLEVREGWWMKSALAGPEYGTVVVSPQQPNHSNPCLVVRPRGDATSAAPTPTGDTE
jgi:hypothetical protein